MTGGWIRVLKNPPQFEQVFKWLDSLRRDMPDAAKDAEELIELPNDTNEMCRLRPRNKVC